MVLNARMRAAPIPSSLLLPTPRASEAASKSMAARLGMKRSNCEGKRERGGRKGERMLSRRPNRRFNGYILPLYPLRSPSLPLSNCLSSSRNRVTKTLSKQVLTDCCFLSGASRKAEGERAREGEAIAIRCIVAERNEDSGQSSGRCGGVQATSASRQKQRQESREGFEEARRKEGRKEDESEGKTRSSVRDDSFFPSFFPLFFSLFLFFLFHSPPPAPTKTNQPLHQL